MLFEQEPTPVTARRKKSKQLVELVKDEDWEVRLDSIDSIDSIDSTSTCHFCHFCHRAWSKKVNVGSLVRYVMTIYDILLWYVTWYVSVWRSGCECDPKSESVTMFFVVSLLSIFIRLLNRLCAVMIGWPATDTSHDPLKKWIAAAFQPR